MAYFAEMRRRNYHKINREQMIEWYKRYLYDIWWDSLSEEEKYHISEKRKQRQEWAAQGFALCLESLLRAYNPIFRI